MSSAADTRRRTGSWGVSVVSNGRNVHADHYAIRRWPVAVVVLYVVVVVVARIASYISMWHDSVCNIGASRSEAVVSLVWDRFGSGIWRGNSVDAINGALGVCPRLLSARRQEVRILCGATFPEKNSELSRKQTDAARQRTGSE